MRTCDGLQNQPTLQRIKRHPPVTRFLFLLFLLGAASLSFAADKPIARHKTSKKERFEPKAEVAAFYHDLLEQNLTVKRQFDRLASKDESFGDVHFGPGDPQVVEWYPKASSWNAGADFNDDARFLVIQPLTFGRPRQYDYTLVVVSEFQVVHTGKTHYEHPERDADQKLDTNEITITFLGFRNFKLTPVKP